MRRTPGRLTATLAVLVTLGLVAGMVAMVGVRQRTGLIDGVTAHSGQLSVAAQKLYRSLSDADATAASAFLSNGLEPAALRQRYQGDIADATAALAVVSAGCRVGPGRDVGRPDHQSVGGLYRSGGNRPGLQPAGRTARRGLPSGGLRV